MRVFVSLFFVVLMVSAAHASGPVSPYDTCSAINSSNTFFGNKCVETVVGADTFSRHAAGACKAIMDQGDGNAFYASQCMTKAANAYVEPHAAAVCGAMKNSFYVTDCMGKVANKTMSRAAADFCKQKADNGDNPFYVVQCVQSIAKDYTGEPEEEEEISQCLTERQVYNRVTRAKNMLELGRTPRAQKILNRVLMALEPCL